MNDTIKSILPADTEPFNTCCFTGHRSIPDGLLPAVRGELSRVVRILWSSGFKYFLCGGALGFDMLAERAILELAERETGVNLILALPCRDQVRKWSGSSDSLREYEEIRASARAVCYVNDFYFDGCMKERNRFMVDNSTFCVAYYNGSFRSGSGQTLRMAQRAGLKTYNIYDALEGARI